MKVHVNKYRVLHGPSPLLGRGSSTIGASCVDLSVAPACTLCDVCVLLQIISCRSEGFALMEYVVPGCVEDGTWMLWGNSVAAAAVAAAAMAAVVLV